jgi:hypothetical protein
MPKFEPRHRVAPREPITPARLAAGVFFALLAVALLAVLVAYPSYNTDRVAVHAGGRAADDLLQFTDMEHLRARSKAARPDIGLHNVMHKVPVHDAQPGD